MISRQGLDFDHLSNWSSIRWLVRHPGAARRFLRERVPAAVAEEAYRTVAERHLSHVFPEVSGVDRSGLDLHVDEVLSTNGWNVLPHESLIIRAITRASRPRRVMEFGTHDGRTTLAIARELPDDAETITFDVPPDHFAAGGDPNHLDRVGREFRGKPEASRIRQVLADTTTFDFSPHHGTCDLIFVDADHSYRSGLLDTKNALACLRPGGTILWHDVKAEFGPLVAGILEALDGRPMVRIETSSLGVWRDVSHA